jgi:hypothetical protein
MEEMIMFCAMIGSLFTVLTIHLIVQYACAVHCPVNSGTSGWKKVSFDSLYSKAVRDLVLDDVLISPKAKQQNLLFKQIQSDGKYPAIREEYKPMYRAVSLPLTKKLR